MSGFVKLLLSLILAIILIIAGAGLYVYSTINSVAVEQEDLRVTVPKGTSIAAAVAILAKEGALAPQWLFEKIAVVASKQYGKTVKAGYHRFPKGITKIELLRGLFSGEYFYYQRVTFPEGITYNRIASIAMRRMGLDSIEFVRYAKNDSLLKARNIPTSSIEGYLHPSTYDFPMDANIQDVVDIMLNAQDKLWNEKFTAQAKSIGKSRHEVLTLASIVEAESPVPDERARVAGVYLNRLAKGMLLQADPTVQYAIGVRRRVLYADLKIEHKYNTYVYAGLPPGPINSPSEHSIYATLHPEQHNYFFMVAVGDGSGRHNFAKNYDEHLRYVRQFRQNARR